jgi:hypothetical protein
MKQNLGQRKYPRCTDSIAIVIDDKEGCSLNIGLGGALVKIEKCVPIMEDLAMKLKLPNGKKIVVNGTCLRCIENSSENDYNVAVFFDETSFTRDGIEELRKFITDSSNSPPFHYDSWKN